MEKIHLENVLPMAFSEKEGIISEIWLQNLELLRGNTYLIAAESGAGKSSFCNFLYGARKDFSGTISFDGKDTRTYPDVQWNLIRKESLSFVFQELLLFDELTAFENVELKNRLTGFQSKDTIMRWFEALGIPDKIGIKVGKLSWGQKQRVALIRALCQPFSFILLDEPTSHLDEKNSEIFGNVLMEETQKQGAAAIITSIGKHMNLTYDKIIRL